MAPTLRRLMGVLLLPTLALGMGCSTYRAGQLYQSGTASLDARDSATAIAELERAAKLAPHASEIRNHLGLAYAQAGRLPEALRAFEHAVALDCDNRAAEQNRAWAEAQLKVPALAAERP